MFAISDRDRLETVVLLHLSRECNDPEIVRQLWKASNAELAVELHIADQDLPLDPIRVFGAIDSGPADELPYPDLMFDFRV